MKRQGKCAVILVLVLAGMAGCSCSGEEIHGAADSATDPNPDEVDDGIDTVDDVPTDLPLEPSDCDRDSDGWDREGCGGSDCNDADPAIHPGAYEVCADGVDQDCDGMDGMEGIRGDILVLLDYIHWGPSLYTLLTWTGTEYAFVWRLFGSDGIYVEHIDPTGKSDPEETRIRDYENAFDLAWSGSGYGSVWARGGDGESSLFFQRLDATGTPVMDEVRVNDRSDLAIDGSSYGGPRIVAAGGEFFVLWNSHLGYDKGLFVTRVDETGAPLIGDVAVSTAMEYIAGINAVWTGSELGAVWQPGNTSPPPSFDVTMRRIRPDGSMLGAEIRLGSSRTSLYSASIQWTGTEYGVFWMDHDVSSHEGYIKLSRVDDAGLIVDTHDVIMFPVLGFPSMGAVWSGASYGLVWYDSASSEGGLGVQRVTPTGDLTGSRILLTSEAPQLVLHIVWAGHEYGVSWTEQTLDPSGDSRIRAYFARVGFCDAP